MSGPIIESQFDKIIKIENQNNPKKIKLEKNSIQTTTDQIESIKLNENFLLSVENSPTIETFSSNYFKKNIPCIINNQMSHWPAIKKWR